MIATEDSTQKRAVPVQGFKDHQQTFTQRMLQSCDQTSGKETEIQKTSLTASYNVSKSMVQLKFQFRFNFFPRLSESLAVVLFHPDVFGLLF